MFTHSRIASFLNDARTIHRIVPHRNKTVRIDLELTEAGSFHTLHFWSDGEIVGTIYRVTNEPHLFGGAGIMETVTGPDAAKLIASLEGSNILHALFHLLLLFPSAAPIMRRFLPWTT